MSRDNSYASSQGDEYDSDDFEPKIFLHITPKADACKHDFQGWREFDDGHGGEQVCTKCGIGAMSYTLVVGRFAMTSLSFHPLRYLILAGVVSLAGAWALAGVLP